MKLLLNSSAIFILSLIAFTTTQAATFTVSNTNDSGAGSLRQAILEANVNNEDDTINFDPAVFAAPQTIILTTGELVIEPDNSSGTSKSLTINGTGANLLTISGNNNSRVFRVASGGALIIDGIKLTGGNGTSNGATPETNARGGAIFVNGGNPGVGIQSLILLNSIVSGNEAVLNLSHGGGLSIFGAATIINSTISNNKTGNGGGGIYSRGRTRIINSTISHNTSATGGGIEIGSSSSLYLINSTVAYNQVINSNPNLNLGGGIYLSPGGTFSPEAELFFRNSIIAKNTGAEGTTSDLFGSPTSEGFNIIGNTTGISIIYGDMIGNQLNVDPLLDPVLRNNGGIVPTHALFANSPAIDTGDNCVLNTTENGGCIDPSIITDQRGVLRPQDGDGDGTATVDIGAFEITESEVINSPNAPDLHSSDDTGVSNSDNITMSRNLSFDISGITNGATVEFFRDGELIASEISNGDTLTFTDTDLPADEVFLYSVRQIIGETISLQRGIVVTIDNIAPTVTINQADGQPDPTNFQAANFIVTFSENIEGFNRNAISLANSTAGVSTANIGFSGSDLKYTVSISNITSDGKLVAEIPANSVRDLAGNMNAASTSTDNSVTIDTTRPTVTINQAAAQADPTRNTPVNFVVVFSEPVTGFTNADISLAGSTANIGSANITVTGSGTTYNVAVSSFSSNGGFIQASVKEHAAADVVGLLSLASTSTDNMVTVDNIAPTVTINQASGQNDPTNSLPINFTVIFSEPVTGFDAADITFSGSSINTTGVNVEVTGSGTTYNVAVNNLTSNGGVLRASVRSSAASDALGNFSFASSSTDNTVTLDNVAPVVSINQALGQNDPTSTQPIRFTVVFNELVTGFSAEKVSLAGSTANVSFADISVSGSGSVYTVNISNITSSGQVRASLAAGAAQDTKGNPSLASTSTDNVVTINVKRPLIDFDGDGKSDISVFRPDDGAWYLLNSSNNSFLGVSFGFGTDEIVPADYDGDGKTDIAVFRPETGTWYLQQSADGFLGVQFGQAGDIPVPADYDGDGKADIAVYRPSTGGWYRLNSSNGEFVGIAFGTAEDKPTIGDFDGDGKADIALFRPSTGSWYRLNSSNGEFVGVPFGIATDTPVPADYDGDGKTDIAVYRDGFWYLLQSTNGFAGFQFGVGTDKPVPADYDGDGKADAAVFRDGNWYLLQSTAGFAGVQFGAATDKPIPNAFVP